MSEDDDYDGWQEVEWTELRNVELRITVGDVTSVDIAEVIRTCRTALSQKAEKLNVILKNLNVYEYRDAILVNDEYGTCPDLEEILKAFGLRVTAVECGLKGKSYVVTDEILDALRVMDPSYRTTRIQFEKCTDEIAGVISDAAKHDLYDSETIGIVRSFAGGDGVTVTGTQTVTYLDDEPIEYGKIESSEREKTISLAYEFFSGLERKTGRINAHMQEGTVSILSSRARKLGYYVQTKRRGGKVQLVLVRNE